MGGELVPIFSFNFTDPGKSLFKKKQPEPLVIEDQLGTFTMKNPETDKFFSGEIDLPFGKVDIMLEPDGNESVSAQNALRHLHTFVPNAADWDTRIKQSAADEFAEKDGTIETWGGCESDSEGETISKEEFMRRIAMNFICFYSDGSIFLDYNLDDMFTDHGLGVNADISGKIESCALWG